MEQYRAESFWEKEPETIAWINSFTNGQVFFDVGANVGVYSLYCAVAHPGCQIFAFEPDAKNCARLLENVKANGFLNVYPEQIAVSDRDGIGVFSEASPVIGGTGGQFDQLLCNGQANYHVTAKTIDSLSIMYANPNHIKIDVDGQELRVIDGMRSVLEGNSLRSVLIELDLEMSIPRTVIMSIFEHHGFGVLDRFNFMENHSRIRRAKEGISVENVIFTRGI